MKRKYCKKCGSTYISDLFVGKECYVCTLKKFPKIRPGKYLQACAISMCISTPLTKAEATVLCNRIGTKGLNKIADVQEYKVVKRDPVGTFKIRLEAQLENDGWI